jgi:hypothetical protein
MVRGLVARFRPVVVTHARDGVFFIAVVFALVSMEANRLRRSTGALVPRSLGEKNYHLAPDSYRIGLCRSDLLVANDALGVTPGSTARNSADLLSKSQTLCLCFAWVG